MIKANFLTPLTKEVNPERPVALYKGIATNWCTMPKNKILPQNEPKEPKKRKEACRGQEKWSTGQLEGKNDQLISLHANSLETQEKI